MKSKLSVLLGTTALIGAMIFGPVVAGTAFARDHDRSDISDEVNEVMDELREEIEELREELADAREEVRDERHEWRSDSRHGDRRHSRIIIDGEERDMTPAERAEFDREMAQFEREMEEFGREMEEMGRDLERELNFEFDGFGEGMAEFAAEMAEFAVEMAGLEGQIMRELEESGIRIESDDNGNETVWLTSDHREGDADMRVTSTSNGDDLVYFYFNGFGEDFDFVLEDGPGDSTIVHAYDTDAVTFETSRRHDGNIETDVDRNGRPQLTIRTRDTDDYEVVRLNRRRFD